MRIKNIPFVIIGMLESKGAGMGGQNQDDRVLIPYTTAVKRITGEKYLRRINLQIASADRTEIAQQQITSLLCQRHRLSEGRDDNFNVFSQKEIADTVNSISKVMTLLLGSIAGISLFVGGFGIMTLVSGFFRRDQAIAIADIDPSIDRAGDRFDQLLGAWIEAAGGNYFRLSSLLSKAESSPVFRGLRFLYICHFLITG